MKMGKIKKTIIVCKKMLQTFVQFPLNLIRGTGMPVKMKVCNAADYNEALKKEEEYFIFLTKQPRFG
jgi:hypothetical protein